MLNTFRAYDPSKIQAKSYSTACEQCYARKVKCELVEDGTKCKQCVGHDIECKSRTRKRKAQSLDESRGTSDENVSSLPGPSAPRSGKDVSGSPSSVTKRKVNGPAKPSRLLKRSTSVSVPELFVNHDSGTSCSQEDIFVAESPVQDGFRNASFLSRSAILGDDFQDIDHAHDRAFYDDKISSTDLKVLKLHGAFELPDSPLRQSLIEAYFERCYTWMPVIEPSSFAGTSQSGETSLLLLQAIILAGSLMRPDVCNKAFCDRQYVRVKTLIHSGYERNPLNVLAALCLVQWYTPTAPKDISTDVPRFWNTYAVGLAQQMGLHRMSTNHAAKPGLRNRIWWTMVARDNLTASAHGRPRIIQPEDCTAVTPAMHDFGDHEDIRAEMFLSYVTVTRILGDLCQLITRKGEASSEDKRGIAGRLQAFLESLPGHLRLYSPGGLAHQYNLELAQLHVPILTAVTILFRPRTVFQLTEANATSVAAAFLSFRIFQAIQLREQTRFLGSAFAWHLLVTAIPLLSCTKVGGLNAEANDALDAIENVLETLGMVRPAAANNLRNVRAIRKAMSSMYAGVGSNNAASDTHGTVISVNLQSGVQLMQAYGHEAVHQFKEIADMLRSHAYNQAELNAHVAAHTLSCLSGRQDPDSTLKGRLTPDMDSNLPSAVAQEDIQNAFKAVFEDDTLSSSWMMRDWMDELQL